jgi:nucleotide-binding universal stress UspA family protein
MRRTILVPLDGSRFAEQALPWAITFARQLNAQLELVLVSGPDRHAADAARAAAYLDGVVAHLSSQLPDAVSRTVLAATASTPPASTAVADTLAGHARDSAAAMIIMTTHGHGGVRRAWLGSVADSLVRMAPVPVLLVRQEDEAFAAAARADRGLKHILIPLDGTETAIEGVAHALDLAGPFAPRITLLRVVSPLSWEVSPHAYDPYPAFASPFSRDAVHATLERTADPLREQGYQVATQVNVDTSPARNILQFATEHDVDLIALGTGGAGPLRRLLLGSVSDKVIRASEAPVLICNTRRMEQAAPAPAGETAHGNGGT